MRKKILHYQFLIGKFLSYIYNLNIQHLYITYFGFFSEISQISWEKLNLPLELIRLLTELIKKIPSKLTYEHWNFILISLVLWQLSIIKSKQNIYDFKVCTILFTLFKIMYHQFFSKNSFFIGFCINSSCLSTLSRPSNFN